ncbi:hypothetical protein [Falsiroseomonas selenitidurans]|uniref:Uncharacterized protein n=1 Tax=Falsiroseomonas selenitidurans TaxID=2716335 RepID=A0ABX1E4D9_9PROT|nr:hypothetical protein [Falsiroseomonas selenitidurans]NKC31866.1 hypothetical protein [Falsiroseomonas selenitidurans]
MLDGPQEELLLLGAEAGRTERLRGLLDRLLGAQRTAIWSLQGDAAALLAYAAGAETATAEGPGLAGLDAWLRGLGLAPLVQRVLGRRIADPPRPAFLRLGINRVLLAGLMGPLGRDADLLEHAQRALSARLLLAVGDPAQGRTLIRGPLPGRLHLPVPPAPIRGGDGGVGGGMLVATLGLETVADPAALAARRAGLAAQGWSVEIDGLDAAALRLLAPEALGADWLRLRWSPELPAAAQAGALQRVEPARLILAAAETPQAVEWARAMGIGLVEGAGLEAPLAPAAPVPSSLLARLGQEPAGVPA